jgi:hypothetical protein
MRTGAVDDEDGLTDSICPPVTRNAIHDPSGDHAGSLVPHEELESSDLGRRQHKRPAA